MSTLVTSPIPRLNRPLRRLARLPVPIILGYLLMQFPVPLGPGTFFDLRNVAPTLTAVIGGPLTGIPVALALAGYRYYLGGVGAVAGAVSLTLAGVLGSLLTVRAAGHVNLSLTRPMRSCTRRRLGAEIAWSRCLRKSDRHLRNGQ